jgi:glycosyltransferase involved in cell wall biosynthesis
MKKVSIIVPIFEVEDYIGDCLTSLVEQTYRNIEILCVNDETPDNSITIVREFQRRDNRIALVQHARNMGLGAARNTAIRHATGEYLKFVDSDDLLLPQSVECLVAAIESEKADWAFSAFQVMNAEGIVQHQRSPFHTSYMEEIGAAGRINFAERPALLNEMWPSAWLPLWRADKIRETGAAFLEGSYYEDHQFFFTHGFQTSTAVYLSEPLYKYRSDRPGQITRDGSRRIYDIFKVLDELGTVLERFLEGDARLRFSARLAVRLLAERTWILPKEGAVVDAYRRRTAEFLSRYPRDLLYEYKDLYISDEDLAGLLGDDAPAGIASFLEASGSSPTISPRVDGVR